MPEDPKPWAREWAGKITRAGESRWVWFGCGAVFVIFTILFIEWVTGRRPGYLATDPAESRPVVPWNAVVREPGSLDPSGSRLPSSLELIPREPSASGESHGVIQEVWETSTEARSEERRPRPNPPGRKSWKDEFKGFFGSISGGRRLDGPGEPGLPAPFLSEPRSHSPGTDGGTSAGSRRTAFGPTGRSYRDNATAKRTAQPAMSSTRAPAPSAPPGAGDSIAREGTGQGGSGLQPGDRMPLPEQVKPASKTAAYGKGFEECTVRVVRHNPSDLSSCVIVCRQGKGCEAPKDGDMCTLPKGTPLTCTGTISPPGVRLTGSISWDKDPSKGVRVFVTNPNGFAVGWRARWFYGEADGVWDDPEVLEPGKTEETSKEPSLKKAEIWGDDTLYFSAGDRKAAGTVHFRFALSLPVPAQDK